MRTLFFGRDGLRAGWRLLIFLLLGQLLGKSLDWLTTKFLGYEYHSGWNPVDLIIDGASTFAVAVFVAWIMGRFEGRTLSTYGLPLASAFRQLFWEGMLWGFVTSTLVVGVIWLAGGASFHGLAISGHALLASAFLWLAAFFLIGLVEEFIYRGYGLRTLTDGMGFWPSALLLSVLFGASHLPKPHESFLDIFNIMAFGLFWCLTLRRTGNLWFAIGFHAMSDYTDMVIYAEPNTGNNGEPLAGHLLNVDFHGPAWLTGGICGTEASVVALAVLLLTVAVFHWRFQQVHFPLAGKSP